MATRTITADTQVGEFTSREATRLYNLTWYEPVAGEYQEFRDPALRNARITAPGPTDMLVVAGLDSREVFLLSYADNRELSIPVRAALSGRPTALVSSKPFPDLVDDNTPADAEQFAFVVVEGVEQADGAPKLQCRQLDTLALLAEVALDRTAPVWFLWGPHTEPDADFIISADKKGVLQIRKADATLELLASLESGIPIPTVVDVQRREDLELEGFSFYRVWHILAFSETGGRGVLLEYREFSKETTVVVPPPRITAASQVGPVVSSMELLSDRVRELTIAASFDPPASSMPLRKL